MGTWDGTSNVWVCAACGWEVVMRVQGGAAPGKRSVGGDPEGCHSFLLECWYGRVLQTRPYLPDPVECTLTTCAPAVLQLHWCWSLAQLNIARDRDTVSGVCVCWR